MFDQNGVAHSRASTQGRWAIFYVYPKDDTPGCTIQGKSFTQEKDKFSEINTSIYGISVDDVESHKNFCNKFGFTITLLADTEAKLLNAMEIGQSEWKGTKFWNRSTIIVDPAGVVQKTYENVDPAGHEQLLLTEIKALQTKTL